MTPIYEEYIRFLKNVTGKRLPMLKEGFFWLDKQIIKAFDKNGILYNLYRVVIEKNLSGVSIHKCRNKKSIPKQLASWEDLIELKKEHLIQLEDSSLDLIKRKMEKYNTHTPVIPISMGKDSMLTCYLVRKLYPETKAIFNNTSLDCADTYRMAKQFPNCEIMNPDFGFYQDVEINHMFPTRFARFCCRIYKVGIMVSQLDHDHPYLMWMGMRNEESNTRSGYQDEWINEQEWGKTCWQGILPIRKWTEIDVWLYTIWKNIEINSKYKKGYSRVGCAIACPYYTKSTWILDKYWYPKMYDRWRKLLREDFIANKKWIVMNCTIDEYLTQAWNGGTFRDKPTEDVIDEFSSYTGVPKNAAVMFFNKQCYVCNKKLKNRTEIAMNLKFHGMNILDFMCKSCFMKLYDMSEERWNMYVNGFKRDGCCLFDKSDGDYDDYDI